MTLERVLTAGILIPIIVAAVWWGPVWLVAVLVGVVTVLALYEFFSLGERAGLRGYPRWTILCALGLVFTQWAALGVETIPLGPGLRVLRTASAPAVTLEEVLLLFVFGVAWLAVAGRRGMGELVPAMAVSSAGLLLVGLPLSYLVRLDGFGSQGRQLLLFLLVLIWVGDTAAYFVGRSIGRLPMAPVLSPKKTWEGAAGNLLGSLTVGWIASSWIDFPFASLLLMAALANVAGQLGDLLESVYKRGAGVKDSGLLLPGHGGMLDRVDSLILAAPVAWSYVYWTTRGRLG